MDFTVASLDSKNYASGLGYEWLDSCRFLTLYARSIQGAGIVNALRVPLAITTSEGALARRASPAIFLIADDGAIGHAFGTVEQWLDPAGGLVPEIARTAANIIADRARRGSSGIGIAGDVLVRLVPSAFGSSELACLTIERLRTRDPIAPAIDRYGLTSREAEVLKHVLTGAGTSAIAAELNIAETTVADHIKSISRKTGARGRGQIVAKMLGFL